MLNFYPEPSKYQTRKRKVLPFIFVLVSNKNGYANTSVMITFWGDVKKWVLIHTYI